MADYHEMGNELGLDLKRHDVFLAGLGLSYQEINLDQKSSPSIGN